MTEVAPSGTPVPNAPKAKAAPKQRTPQFNPRTTYRPEEIASKLGISGKVLRGHLRAKYARKATEKGTTWVVPGKIANECAKHFAARRATSAK